MIHVTRLFLFLILGLQLDEALTEDLGAFISCLQTGIMRVEVNLTKYPPLIAEKMHLNDPNCKATDLNETFAVFDIPIDGCGTHGDGSNPEYLLFSNAVHWTPEASEGVLQTRIKGYIAHISCRYPTHGKASAHIKLKESGKF